MSITLLVCEMSAIAQQFEHSLTCPSLGLESKLTFSSPVATAEFSKFAGMLSAALSQHHLGFEIAQLELGDQKSPHDKVRLEEEPEGV